MTEKLTARELDVLRRMADGGSYSGIAAQFKISPNTAEWYGKQVLRKLGARNMTNAVLLACRAGLLDGKPRRHGDHAGFAAHQYRGEDPWACTEGCPEGERAYRAERRRARREAKAAAA